MVRVSVSPGATRLPAGQLIFTVERTDDDRAASSGYRLNPHGRYSHTEPYVRGVLAGAGLTVRTLGTVHLRLQGGVPVVGMVVVAGSSG